LTFAAASVGMNDGACRQPGLLHLQLLKLGDVIEDYSVQPGHAVG